jgi:hypothetical protein
MSVGYNLSFDYDYLNKIRKQVMEMEKKNPYWEPKFESEKRQMRGRGFPPVGAERRTVDIMPYAKYNVFYEQVPKGYKSSGNDGYNYYHQNELDNINKMKMPTINYEKNNYNNANKPIAKDKIKINESIFKAVDNDFDKDLLKGYGMKDITPQEKAMVNLIVRTGKKLEGGISKASFKKALKISAPIARKIASTGVQIGLPIVGSLASEALGIPPPVGYALGKVTAKALSKKIGGFRAIHPVKKVSLLDNPKLKGGKMTKAQKEKLAKNLIKTFGAVALAGATKLILPKVLKYLESNYGITPELAREVFGLARFFVGAVVEANVSGGGCGEDGDDDCDVGYIGKGYKDTVLGQRDKELHDKLSKLVSKHLKGGKLSVASFKKEALKLGKKGAPVLAKHAIPLATKAIGDSLGLPPNTTKVVGKVLGDVVSQHLKGLGEKKAIKADIGKYKGGAKKVAKLPPKRPVLAPAKSGGKSRLKDRSVLVKKIMQEKGLSLPQASKYIKENNLSY